jgi:hypothetical protein
MFDTIFGLPTHILTVHAVVVLLPLAAVGAVAVAVVPWLRRRFGVLVALLTIAGVAAVPVATRSGERLMIRRSSTFGPDEVNEAALMQKHVELGDKVLPWAILLLVGVLLVVGVPLLLSRSAGGPPAWLRWFSYAAAVVTLAGAVLTVIAVARAGHAGSKAVWDGVVHPPAAIGSASPGLG